MLKKLLLPVVALVVLCVATPSFATFWERDHKDWDFDWSKLQEKLGDHEWDRETKHEWPDRNDIKEWLENKDWSRDGHDWGNCRKDNPIPEPATAGLSLMGLAALGVVTRRRRK